MRDFIVLLAQIWVSMVLIGAIGWLGWVMLIGLLSEIAETWDVFIG